LIPQDTRAGASPRRITLHGEFARVIRTRPDWLYGMLCSWLLGLATFGYLIRFTHPDLVRDPLPTIAVVVLTAVADGSLTNQLGAEPGWAADLLRDGVDPARILRMRNGFLLICESLYVGAIVALTARVGHSTAWISHYLPEIMVLPLAPIAIGNLASVLVPTPFMRLNKRLQATGSWPRWSIYVAIPFVLSSISGAMFWMPSVLEQHWQPRVIAGVRGLDHGALSAIGANREYVLIWLVITPLWQLFVWFVSLRLADSLARVRRRGLVKLFDRHAERTDELPDISLYQAARALPKRVREIPAGLRAEIRLLASEILETTTTLSRL
jgi:hypothetical protein